MCSPLPGRQLMLNRIYLLQQGVRLGAQGAGYFPFPAGQGPQEGPGLQVQLDSTLK